ncbi:hypothetical protein [Aestuariibacter salexigens]|uniref:hypothetical protein n=1 Tax=Aestuariibacter salexigens TaxID=226010 RepID=UPI000410080C|nr:hypothetical protein [Aestuariibacter salexigens]
MFQSGLNVIDKLVAKYGLSLNGNNPFKAVTKLSKEQADSASLNLPYCMYNKVKSLTPHDDATLIRFFLPDRHARLAAFLIVNGHIVEQVYYQRDKKYVTACKKIQRELDLQLASPALFAA